jgi:predicted Kef-type K+ transport protein
MLLVFFLGFTIEDQGWGLRRTVLAGLALVAASTIVALLTLLLLDRRREHP